MENEENVDCYISWSKNITYHSPHQRKSNSPVPGHDQSSPLLCWCLMISHVSSLLFHSLTYILGQHLSQEQPNPLLSCHRSLRLCSVMKLSVLIESYWGLAGRTAAPWLGSAFERSWADLMVLWTQQRPLPVASGQKTGAGSGLHRLPLRFLTLGWWRQKSETWSPYSWDVPASRGMRFCDILCNCWPSHSQLHSIDWCSCVTHCTEGF